MAILNRKFAAVFVLAGLVTGCASSVKVVKNPGEGDTGIRFFRPKPFLLVTPADPTGRLVNMKLEYLPDYSEEYSAHVKGKASVALKDGWNLVGVNTKEAPAAPPEPPAKIDPALLLPNAVVAATNVPIGYYESVISKGGNGKVLTGWRYIGLTTLGGGQAGFCREDSHAAACKGAPNGCITGPLYGLVFFNGVMTFRQLDEIANNQLCPMFVNPTGSAGPIPAESRGTDFKKEVEDRKMESVPATPKPGSASLSRTKSAKSVASADKDANLLRSASSTLSVSPVR